MRVIFQEYSVRNAEELAIQWQSGSVRCGGKKSRLEYKPRDGAKAKQWYSTTVGCVGIKASNRCWVKVLRCWTAEAKGSEVGRNIETVRSSGDLYDPFSDQPVCPYMYGPVSVSVRCVISFLMETS
jgi:hypothetical protein